MVSCLLACVYVDEIGLQCFSFNWLSLRRRFCGGKAGTQEQFCVSLCISIKKKTMRTAVRACAGRVQPHPVPDQGCRWRIHSNAHRGSWCSLSLPFSACPQARRPRLSTCCLCHLPTLEVPFSFNTQGKKRSWRKGLYLVLTSGEEGRWPNGVYIYIW